MVAKFVQIIFQVEISVAHIAKLVQIVLVVFIALIVQVVIDVINALAVKLVIHNVIQTIKHNLYILSTVSSSAASMNTSKPIAPTMYIIA